MTHPAASMPSQAISVRAVAQWSRPLAIGAGVSAVLLAIALTGLLVDNRVITGAPAWLKPVKFGASSAVYLFSLAWLVKNLPRTIVLRVATFLIACILVLEVLLVYAQALRGTTSHFNFDTRLDGAVFSSMGIGIGIVWVLSMLLLVMHLRTRASDRAMALALRIGLALNIVGAGVGWTMTQPRPGQIQAMRRGQHPFVIGSHTVGAPDGGPGLPLVNWSREHGDLRIPHFLGMHALQVLPLLLIGVRSLRTRRDDSTETTVILLASAVCAGVFAAALLQALAGHPLLPPPTG